MSTDKTSPSTEQPTQAEQAEKARPRKKRRWLKILVVVVVLLVLLVAAAPWILSLGIARSIAQSQANATLKGGFSIEGIELSWLGSSHVTGFKVTDLDDRTVLEVDNVTYGPGLISAIGSPYDIGTVTVGATRVTLYLDETGQPSIAEAFASKVPSDEEPGELPPIRGVVVYGPIEVTVVRHDGKTMKQTIEGDVTLKTLADIAGEQTTTFADGGVLKTEYIVKDAVTDGTPTPMKMQADVSLVSEEAIDLGSLLSFASGVDGVQGTLSVNTRLALKEGQIDARLDNRATGLRERLASGQLTPPVTLTLEGNVTADRKRSGGQVTLGGDLGSLTTTLDVAIPDEPVNLDAKTLMDALLEGKRLELPEMTVNTSGQLDVARLMKSVPRLAGLRPDVTVQQGRFVVGQARLTGGVSPALVGDVSFEEFVVRRQDRTLELEPTHVKWDVSIVPGTGLKIQSTKLDAPGVTFTAGGTLSDLEAGLSANLGTLRETLSQVFDLGDRVVTGTVDGTFTMKRPDEGRMVFGSTLALKQIVDPSVAEGVLLQDTVLKSNGTLHLEDNVPQRLELDRSVLDIDRLVTLRASGTVDFAGSASGKLTMPPTSFDHLARLASRVGFEDLKHYSGSVQLDATGGADWRNGPAGNYDVLVKARQVTIDNQPVGGDDMDLTATGKLTTEPGNRLVARGQSRAKLLRSGRGLPTGRDGDGTFVYDVVLDRAADRLVVNTFKLKTEPLTMDTRGSIDRLADAKVMDLEGSYELSWDKATELLHKLLPETAGDVTVSGTVKHDFTVTGSAYHAGMNPVFKELSSALVAGWDSARIMGLEMGKARLEPTLQEGVFRIPEAVIPSGKDGKIRFGGKVDFRETDPRFVLPGKLHMWEAVEINREMAQKLLSRAMPMLAQSSSISGTVDLYLEEVDVPLSKAIFKTGSGRGHFSFSNLRLAPAGALGKLVSLASSGAPMELTMKDIRVDFEIVNGGIRYDDFTLDFGGRSLTLSGMVYFNDSISLDVRMPVGRELIKLAGFSDKVDPLMKALEDVSLTMSVGGTRTDPVLKLDEVDYKSIVSKAARGLLLNTLLPKDDKPKDEQPKDDQPKDDQPEAKQDRPKRTEDVLLDILQGVLKKQREKNR